jgi:hypothetical protein
MSQFHWSTLNYGSTGVSSPSGVFRPIQHVLQNKGYSDKIGGASAGKRPRERLPAVHETKQKHPVYKYIQKLIQLNLTEFESTDHADSLQVS